VAHIRFSRGPLAFNYRRTPDGEATMQNESDIDNMGVNAICVTVGAICWGLLIVGPLGLLNIA